MKFAPECREFEAVLTGNEQSKNSDPFKSYSNLNI